MAHTISTRTTRKALASSLLALALVVAGCSEPDPGPSAAVVSEIQLPADYSATGPGALVSATRLPTIDRRLLRVTSVAARITYNSTSGVDGSSQVVSGSVFAPAGPPPEGGWPVIVFGHGTTGVLSDCAPSLSPTLLGAAEAVRALVTLGYVMVVPDYQGLGTIDSYHPYLDATTAGYNMVDAASAARKLVPDSSERWVAFGVSQGGQASWAANELIAGYGAQDTRLIGSVSVSPAADITGLADMAAEGILSPQQRIAMVLILSSLQNAHPGFKLDDYRRGLVEEKWDLLAGCSTDATEDRLAVAEQIPPEDLRPATPEALDTLRGYLNQMSGLPRAPASAPMFVVHGDADDVVPVAWTTEAVRRACEMGDTVASFIAGGRGHGDFDPIVSLDWIMKRFDDAPADSTCGVEGGPSILKTT
ncbi:lipase [Mycobacterium sp. Root265]|uniref:lipase family protein n=1 Tax=Mycobacterium sp. Root265 TaxID=1736504 RepID=UPI00071051DF|nr:lipase family protein [Mycobacterium sp. Root265]KRD15353.1 lipase [Mycobacterium sp. Root265]